MENRSTGLINNCISGVPGPAGSRKSLLDIKAVHLFLCASSRPPRLPSPAALTYHGLLCPASRLLLARVLWLLQTLVCQQHPVLSLRPLGLSLRLQLPLPPSGLIRVFVCVCNPRLKAHGLENWLK